MLRKTWLLLLYLFSNDASELRVSTQRFSYAVRHNNARGWGGGYH